jgi:hypothetical protein
MLKKAFYILLLDRVDTSYFASCVLPITKAGLCILCRIGKEVKRPMWGQLILHQKVEKLMAMIQQSYKGPFVVVMYWLFCEILTSLSWWVTYTIKDWGVVDGEGMHAMEEDSSIFVVGWDCKIPRPKNTCCVECHAQPMVLTMTISLFF